MIVGLKGPICSGKSTLAKYMEDQFEFKPIYLRKFFIEHVLKEYPEMKFCSEYHMGKTFFEYYVS